jgi:hypothetical protein
VPPFNLHMPIPCVSIPSVVFVLLQETQCFFSFNHVADFNEYDPRLSTWVPARLKGYRYCKDDDFRIAQTEIFSASGQSQLEASIYAQSVLCVPAIYIDRVGGISWIDRD